MATTQEKTFVLTAEQSDPETVAAQVRHASRFDGIAIALGAIALIAMVSAIIREVMPFLSIFALFLLLFPFREYRTARVIMFTAGVLLAFWLIVTLAGLLFPFIIGLLIAYLFNPLVTKIEEKWKISRGWSAFVLVFLLTGLVVFLGILFIPGIVYQLEALMTT